MEFKPIYCNVSGDARYETEIDGKTYRFQISREAFEDDLEITEDALKDDLKEALTKDQRKKLECVIRNRIANRLFEPMTNERDEPCDVILIRTGDLA